MKEVRSEEGARGRTRERDAGVGTHLPIHMYVSTRHLLRCRLSSLFLSLPSLPSFVPGSLFPSISASLFTSSNSVAPSLFPLVILFSFSLSRLLLSLSSVYTSAFGLSRSFRPRISRAWRFTLNVSPFPSAVSREHARWFGRSSRENRGRVRRDFSLYRTILVASGKGKLSENTRTRDTPIRIRVLRREPLR